MPSLRLPSVGLAAAFTNPDPSQALRSFVASFVLVGTLAVGRHPPTADEPTTPNSSACKLRLAIGSRRLLALSDKSEFSSEEARAAGERIGIGWGTSPFDVEQFRMGMDVELEHGTRDLETNVTDDDVTVTAKIARAHLNEFPDYYSRLAVMEAEAEAYWASKGA